MELTGQQWPKEMIDLLLEVKAATQERKGTAAQLEPEKIKGFEQRYEQIIHKGYLENPPPEKSPQKKWGRKKQSRAVNMLDRLKERRQETLAFMYDFNVPFDNNQAERDLRMAKVKQKISGVFRSGQGAKFFCRVRGYISTARKNSGVRCFKPLSLHWKTIPSFQKCEMFCFVKDLFYYKAERLHQLFKSGITGEAI